MEVLLKQKASVLKSLATSCGIPSTGTKSVIATNILTDLNNINNVEHTYAIKNHGSNMVTPNVLAIDPGIKNFSYCKFRYPSEASGSLTGKLKPVVEEWNKVNLLSKYSYLGIEESKLFSPNNFSKIVYELCKDLALIDGKCKIDLVLIEQQRFRSGGSSQVLEWTLRVNMLEIMLHSFLYSLNKQSNLRILPSNPRKMSNYLLMTHDQQSSKSLSAQKSIKSSRINIVNDWIDKLNNKTDLSSVPFEFNREISTKISTYFNSEAYLKKRTKKSGCNTTTSRFNDIFNMIVDDKENCRTKSDDLVDSLLHGVTYYSWLYNKGLLKLRIYKDKTNEDLADLLENMKI